MILIISGQQRSGTTMLRYLCHSHPDVSVTHEFGCFLDIGKSFERYSRSLWLRCRNVQGRWGFTDTFPDRRRNHRRNCLFSLRYLFHVWRSTQSDVGLSAAEQALKRLFKGKAIVGDKLPQYRNRLSRLVTQENVRNLLIYRDCRDVTSSFLAKKRSDWKGLSWADKLDSAGNIAEQWVRDIERMESAVGEVYIVRYEQLVNHHESVLPHLAQWLGVSSCGFDTGVLNSNSVGKYKQGLTPNELAEVIDVAGPTLARLDYI